MELDTSVPLIRFTVLDELIQAIRNTFGDALYAQGVSPTDFAIIADAEKRPYRVRCFYAERKLLIITIMTALHERLHVELSVDITGIIHGMGLKNQWSQAGATLYRARGHPGGDGDGAEGDSTAYPQFERKERDAWPTLIIEAGHSQSLQELRTDMRWWFSASDNEVKIVLLVKMDTAKGRILLEKYQASSSQRLGATTTRSHLRLGPTCTPAIEITRRGCDADIMDPSSYTVTSALQLEFNLLFLRQPGVGEHDVVVGAPNLQVIASKIWQSF
ncbi:hypothetical protein HJFPF1_02785 [Paramyrothecium foliicola]|nr:hypothetical protein HJFPF1_02785 [Paramyrothecium foliicola]